MFSFPPFIRPYTIPPFFILMWAYGTFAFPFMTVPLFRPLCMYPLHSAFRRIHNSVRICGSHGENCENHWPLSSLMRPCVSVARRASQVLKDLKAEAEFSQFSRMQDYTNAVSDTIRLWRLRQHIAPKSRHQSQNRAMLKTTPNMGARISYETFLVSYETVCYHTPGGNNNDKV
jgi:hypothetical protein